MVVGRQRDAAQTVTPGIVGRQSADGIDGNSLEYGLHCLFTIHRNGGLSICADNSTCGIQPLLKLVAEVLGGCQLHLRTFFICLHVRVTADASCLGRRQHLCVQRIFRHLLCGTD